MICSGMANMIPPHALLEFYRQGMFPMAEGGELRLFSPDPRGIFPLGGFRIPHGTAKSLRSPAWVVRLDSAFPEVVVACANRRETWIDETIFHSYCALHRAGHAHSVEVWSGGELAGGLYGVRLGAAFFGESMFHRVTDASKVALCCLVAILRQGGFLLLDTQWVTPHLAQFGAVEVPRAVYRRMLASALIAPADWPDDAPPLPDVQAIATERAIS